MTHEHRQPHPPERHAKLMRDAVGFRGIIPHIIVREIYLAMQAPLDVPGLGRIVAYEYSTDTYPSTRHEHGAAVALLSALAGGAEPPALPVALSLAPEGQTVVWLRTRRQWEALREAWRARKVEIHSRAALAVEEIHDQLDIAAGITPIKGDDGQTLTGLPALAAREALWADINRWYNGNPATALQTRILTGPHPAEGTLATDVPIARAQLMDRLDAAAKEMRRWLLDGGACDANAAQATALQLLESRRQAGRRTLRAATTSSVLLAAVTSAESLIRGVGIEDAPAWQAGGGTAITGDRYSTTYAAPAEGTWTLGLRAVNPSPTSASKSAADLGDVVLDAADPEGWTVTSAPRAAPHAHERTVTIAWGGADAPAAGTYDVELTARNACGPAMLTVTITVPAPASE